MKHIDIAQKVQGLLTRKSIPDLKSFVNVGGNVIGDVVYALYNEELAQFILEPSGTPDEVTRFAGIGGDWVFSLLPAEGILDSTLGQNVQITMDAIPAAIALAETEANAYTDGAVSDYDAANAAPDSRYLRADIDNATGSFTDISLTGKLIADIDTDTYLQFTAPNEVSLFAGGVAQVIIDTTNTTFSGKIIENSDMRLKENVEGFGSRGIIGDILPVTFNKKTSPEIKEIGFIAQDVELLYPELVDTHPTTGIKSVSYSRMTAVLLQHIIELDARVKELENK